MIPSSLFIREDILRAEDISVLKCKTRCGTQHVQLRLQIYGLTYMINTEMLHLQS